MSEQLQLATRFTSTQEHETWLRGVRDVCQVLDVHVDAAAFGGGIPTFLTLTVNDEPPAEPEDASDTAEATTLADSEGPSPDSEQESPPRGSADEG